MEADKVLKKNVNRCIKCGTKGIIVYDCGYSSFNPGWAKCTGCGIKVEIEICGEPPAAHLRSEWNRKNPKPQKAISRIDDKIDKLKIEKKRLKKLFKV